MLRVIVGALLLLFPGGSPRPVTRMCRVGNVSFPVSVFESYAGWECYEETYTGMKELTVHVCVEGAEDGEEYSVPCFKWNGRMLSFNLKNEESVLAILNVSESRELNDEMIRCYLNVVSACETSPDGWLSFHGGCRSFFGNASCALEGESKFHVAMLSISLIIGIPVAIIFFYCSLTRGSAVLSHSRNLVAALILRSLFSLLIETEVISVMIQLKGEPVVNWPGCEALASFETIALNLVLAFWLILTIYLFESSKSLFQKTPEIRGALYMVLGLSFIFPVIWMIIMGAGSYGNCWLERTPVQWVNDSLRLGFIVLQVLLAGVTCFRIVADLRGPVSRETRFKVRVAVTTLLLSPLFLLQFSLSASHPLDSDEAHTYTEFFFDGLQCGIVSSVVLFIGATSNKMCRSVFEMLAGADAELRRGDEPPRAARHLTKGFEEEERKDVTYTSVLTPERFERTIKLYNRLNVIPKQVTPAPEEMPPDNSSAKSEYFDVDNDSGNTVYNDVVSQPDAKCKFYTSKYLVHDTESSGSEESVIEVAPAMTESVRSSSSSTSDTLPTRPADASRDIEEWLANCRCEFEDYAERVVRSKTAAPAQNTIHRSLSGSILTYSELPGSVRVVLKGGRRSESVRAKQGSAPSMVASEKERPTGRKPEELPSIYDDLKAYSRQKNAKIGRKRDYSADWSSYRNRVLDKRRKVKSFDSELQRAEGDGLSQQVNALLAPGSLGNDVRCGALHKPQFAGVEDLSRVGESDVDNETETGFADDRKTDFARGQLLRDVNDVKI